MKTLVSQIYYYQDELGSTSHVADSTGHLLEYYKYNLYGGPTYWDASNSQLQSSNYGVKDLFTGQRYVSAIGLYDDRNRFMSPDLGRFLQPDPIGFKGDSSNLYRYCGNDWGNRSDPMGTSGDQDDRKNIKPETQHNGWDTADPYAVEKLKQHFQAIFDLKAGLGYGASALGGLQNQISQLSMATQGLTMAGTDAIRGGAPRILVNYNRDSTGRLQLIQGDKTLLHGSVVVGGQDNPTPTGTFHASYWEKDHTSKLYGWKAATPWSKAPFGMNAFGPYQLHIRELDSRGIFIHGTMGPGANPYTLLNRLVSPVSHGCVRMSNSDIIRLHALLPHPEGISITISAGSVE